MNSRNNIGLIMVPWGTPAITLLKDEGDLLMTTRWHRSVMKYLIQFSS